MWRNHSRSLNNEINKLHERTIKLVYSDRTSTLQELLNKDDSVTVHLKICNIAPVIISELLSLLSVLFNLRNDLPFQHFSRILYEMGYK